MVSKEIKEFFKKHRRIEFTCEIILGVIFTAIIIFALLQGMSAWDNHAAGERANAMEANKNSGLVAPNLVASSNATKTVIYSLDDPECGFALILVVSDWGMNPPASVNGKRIKRITTLPPEGFKQISGSIAENLDTVPEVCRYVNLSRNEVIYYAYGSGSSCRFDLFEKTNPA